MCKSNLIHLLGIRPIGRHCVSVARGVEDSSRKDICAIAGGVCRRGEAIPTANQQTVACRAEARHGVQCLVLARGARSSKVRRKKTENCTKFFLICAIFCASFWKLQALKIKDFAHPKALPRQCFRVCCAKMRF